MSRLGRRVGLAPVLVALLCGASCSSNGPTTDPKDAATGDDGGQLQQCTPNQPEKHKPDSAGYFTFAALPTGACSGSGSCWLGVYGPCGDDPEYVGHPYNTFRCMCTAGAWSCAIESAGASICSIKDSGTSPDSADTHSPMDSADAGTLSGECRTKDEQSCGLATQCWSVRAKSLKDHCNNTSSTFFAGCVAGGPDGGQAVIWAREEGTGRVAQFPTTQLPNGWLPTASPDCTADAGP